ncbi:PVC-type heme-binding CxxCH protein [Emticicia sp. C21]|uniref:PVC-type heme-binding CxxCH protein n=1 Tax=Emticicia sp. C21 TaxID=2302915 RepID=UPI000E3536F8|nr:PVC-type heme-binding CxxCH protein [Emticicia sp. C21]RFS18040.1 dehydrogenase [Emticicia sp. C21]
MYFSKKAPAIFSVSAALVLATAFAPTPDDDKNKLYVPDDLEATLWAETPMLHNPTNMDVDYKGRIWITEAVDYRNFNTKPGERINNEQQGDRVVILEDTDGDGKADKSKVFVQDKDLVAPLGIAVIGKKVIVSAAPNLIVFTDENGDDVPDKKEILLKGFGGVDHDHSLHSVTAGPDGNWHFNTGNAGPHNVTDKGGWTLRSGSSYYGGTPYNKSNQGNQKSDDGRVWVGGLALRMDTEGKNLKVMGHNFRNSYEVGLDSYGNMWQNDNDDQVITCRVSYLMEGGNAGYFSADGTRFWQADRRPGQEMFTAHWHQEDPGVQPAIDNSGAGSPTGIAFYESDALGENYRGTLLSCEAGRNVVFSYQPTIQGGGFKMERHNMISSFPKTHDHYIWHDTSEDVRKWFRPSDVVAGTDGAIYVADWYDPVVGGHAMHDKKAHGRIFRITPKGKKLTPPTIDLTTVRGQIETLKNPAINVRNLGFEALRKGGHVAEVKRLLKDSNPYIQARAVWLLSKMDEEGVKEVEKVLDNQDINLKITAFRALRQVKTDILPIAEKLSTDKNVAVRREVAIALRDLPLASIKGIVNNLVKAYNGTDRFEIEAIGQALDGKENAYYQSIKPTLSKDPTTWNEPTATLIWRLHPVEAINDLKLRASARNLNEAQRKQALTALAFIKDKRAVMAMLDLTKNPFKDVSEQAFWWVNFRKTNDWADLMDWEKAANTQMSAQQKQMLGLEKQMLDKKQPQATREKAAEKLANDGIGGKMLLSLAGENRLPKEVRNVVAANIFNNPDKSIRMMASDYFLRPSGKEISVNLALEMPSDMKKGYEVFRKNCATCHKFDKEGAEIGPELTQIGKKFDKAGLLDAIVNPSASMAFGYEPLIVTTKDKNTYYGFLVGDGETLTLKDVAGQLTSIKKANIASRKQLKNSLMPEPSSMGLKEKDLSDLAGYLLKLPLAE